MSILPSWVAYVLFQSGITNGISEEEESAKLLRPIGIILGIYQGIMWLCKMFMIPTDVLIINETASILSLYSSFIFFPKNPPTKVPAKMVLTFTMVPNK
mgnify:CR=1 FL=1